MYVCMYLCMFNFMLFRLPRNLHVLVSLPILCLQMISTDTNRTWQETKHARSWVDFVMCSDSMENGTYHGERSTTYTLYAYIWHFSTQLLSIRTRGPLASVAITPFLGFPLFTFPMFHLIPESRRGVSQPAGA